MLDPLPSRETQWDRELEPRTSLEVRQAQFPSFSSLFPQGGYLLGTNSVIPTQANPHCVRAGLSQYNLLIWMPFRRISSHDELHGQPCSYLG